LKFQGTHNGQHSTPHQPVTPQRRGAPPGPSSHQRHAGAPHQSGERYAVTQRQHHGQSPLQPSLEELCFSPPPSSSAVPPGYFHGGSINNYSQPGIAAASHHSALSSGSSLSSGGLTPYAQGLVATAMLHRALAAPTGTAVPTASPSWDAPSNVWPQNPVGMTLAHQLAGMSGKHHTFPLLGASPEVAPPQRPRLYPEQASACAVGAIGGARADMLPGGSQATVPDSLSPWHVLPLTRAGKAHLPDDNTTDEGDSHSDGSSTVAHPSQPSSLGMPPGLGFQIGGQPTG